MGKVIFFLSTGRTGTKKIATYLKAFCPPQVAVDHQTSGARLINVLANMHHHGFSVSELIDKKIRNILKKYKDNVYYINCDPLLSFGLGCVDFRGFDASFVHLERNADDFVKSMINWQFTKTKSYIAHNFVPFWQPGIWPFEHIIHRYNKERMKNKYRQVWLIKNRIFKEAFGEKYPYLKIEFEELFDPRHGGETFRRLVDFIGIEIEFHPEIFFQRENVSVKGFFR